jgi:hypothetical protein
MRPFTPAGAGIHYVVVVLRAGSVVHAEAVFSEARRRRRLRKASKDAQRDAFVLSWPCACTTDGARIREYVLHRR